ncbi:MAG: tetratricopeptide repeat protein [Pirellulales bacterium]|nr:tetratricopeptide repeat protein [Pirellulales bacterium]
MSVIKFWLRWVLRRISPGLLISGAALALFLLVLYWMMPEAVPGLAQRGLGLVFAALVGAVYFYATRDPDLHEIMLAHMRQGQHLDFGKQVRADQHVHKKLDLPVLGETTVRSIVGVCLILVSFAWWLTPFAPVAVAQREIEDVSVPLTSGILAVVLVSPDAELVVAQPPTVPMAAQRLAKRIPNDAPPMLLVRKAIALSQYDLARQRLEEAASDESIERIEIELAHAQNSMYAGAFAEAAEWYEKVLERDPDNPTLLAQAAVAGLHEGDFRKTQQLISQALKNCRSAKPEEAFRLATCLHIQAAAFTIMAYRYDLAENNNRRAQQLWSGDLPPEHHEGKAAGLNNQAVVFALTGNLPGARSMGDWAVDEWEKIDERSPRLASALANEAMRLHIEGRYFQSQEVADRGLAMLRNTLPIGHPVIAMGMDNVAVTDLALGEYERATPADVKALVPTFEGSLGRQYPMVAAAMNIVADSYLVVALPDKARSYYEQALGVTEASLGAKHPYMITGLMGLAEVFLRQEQYEQARSNCEQARQIAEKAFGERHAAIARCMLMDARILMAEGKGHEARGLFDGALEITKKRFGDVHPLVADSLAGLGALDDGPRTIAGGIARFEEALKIYEQLLGPGYERHPAVARLLFSMAKLQAKRGEVDKARQLLARCLQIQQQVLVPYDPQLADTLTAQAKLLRAEKPPKTAEAEALEKRAEKIRENYVKENRR